MHPPAGIVSGDELRIKIDINEHAHALITTLRANRFYRARKDLTIGDSKQIQITSINLKPLARCENFPLETIVYEGADGFNTVDIHLAGDSIYLGWDITCLGLPKSDQMFVHGRYTQLNKVFCDDTLIYHDRIAITPDNNIHQHVAGLNKHNVFATFLAHAPFSKVDEQCRVILIEQLRDVLKAEQSEELVSITQIRQLLVIRYLGEHAEQCKRLFVILWKILRPLYADKSATMPRIWHT
ncbi:urease accessory protein UreD [Psychrosphaera algicola]|uniref:Urease accessory protein UreD n=1 Tax=Psychrosphaera algicola TaxID=3023714 RepID=A0ABT5FIT9_9GAMM|nr:urease accessory protein UreD [Psychrosphaera sp. G1-22]MDC2891112.1 urease accessory protein UreD [Psychrosphaera sp. G1-22]